MNTTPDPAPGLAADTEHDVEGFASDFFNVGIIAVHHGDLLPAVRMGLPLITPGAAESGWDVKARKAGG